MVNEQDNKLAWMKRPERTAGEPSYLGFSHFKAANQDPMLNSVDTLLRMVPFLVGFSTEAWQVNFGAHVSKIPNQQ